MKTADTGALQPYHLSAKEQAGMKILPIAVIDVAGEQDKVHALREGGIDQPFERAAGRSPQPLDRRSVVTVEAA